MKPQCSHKSFYHIFCAKKGCEWSHLAVNQRGAHAEERVTLHWKNWRSNPVTLKLLLKHPGGSAVFFLKTPINPKCSLKSECPSPDCEKLYLGINSTWTDMTVDQYCIFPYLHRQGNVGNRNGNDFKKWSNPKESKYTNKIKNSQKLGSKHSHSVFVMVVDLLRLLEAFYFILKDFMSGCFFFFPWTKTKPESAMNVSDHVCGVSHPLRDFHESVTQMYISTQQMCTHTETRWLLSLLLLQQLPFPSSCGVFSLSEQEIITGITVRGVREKRDEIQET